MGCRKNYFQDRILAIILLSNGNYLAFHIKELAKEETQPKVRKRKKIKIRTERQQIEARKIKKINVIKKHFSEMINKIDKPLARLRKIMEINITT